MALASFLRMEFQRLLVNPCTLFGVLVYCGNGLSVIVFIVVGVGLKL